MLNKKQQSIVDEYVNRKPMRYIIPEPPRGNIVRIFNRGHNPPFVVVGADNDYEWRSLAKILDTSKNYWDKTPLSDEQLWVNGLWLFLAPVEDNKFFAAAEEYTLVGTSLYTEDDYDSNKIQDARGRAEEILPKLMAAYEDKLVEGLALLPKPKPKRKGRPKGAKNKVKEKTNG